MGERLPRSLLFYVLFIRLVLRNKVVVFCTKKLVHFCSLNIIDNYARESEAEAQRVIL